MTEWEVIAVDDKSTDGSGEYLDKLQDRRVRVFHSAKNQGACAALNHAILESKGRWLARMDADDVCMPERLERQLAILSSEEIDLLGTGSYVTDRDLQICIVNRPPAQHADITRRASLEIPLTFGAVTGRCEWWRRWMMDKRVGIAGYEFDLYFRSHRHSQFANIRQPLYIYRFFGHTRSWRKMSLSAYYKCGTLIRHGFVSGEYGNTMLGLFSMIPRPLLYAAKMVANRNTALSMPKDASPTLADQEIVNAIVRSLHAQYSSLCTPASGLSR
jgi:glycosyltransferase involved in cell wall biosynthesis